MTASAALDTLIELINESTAIVCSPLELSKKYHGDYDGISVKCGSSGMVIKNLNFSPEIIGQEYKFNAAETKKGEATHKYLPVSPIGVKFAIYDDPKHKQTTTELDAISEEIRSRPEIIKTFKISIVGPLKHKTIETVTMDFTNALFKCEGSELILYFDVLHVMYASKLGGAHKGYAPKLLYSSPNAHEALKWGTASGSSLTAAG